jgi:hypothetical protein
MSIQSLRAERKAHDFKMLLIGLSRLLETYLDMLEDDSREISVVDLQYMHFNRTADEIEEYLADPANAKAFKGFYPGHIHLLAYGFDIVPALERLHEAREEALSHHSANPNDPEADVHRDLLRGDPNLTARDRAIMLGDLSQDQLSLYDAQLNRTGHMLLSAGERRALAAAFRAEMTDPPETISTRAPKELEKRRVRHLRIHERRLAKRQQ